MSWLLVLYIETDANATTVCCSWRKITYTLAIQVIWVVFVIFGLILDTVVAYTIIFAQYLLTVSFYHLKIYIAAYVFYKPKILLKLKVKLIRIQNIPKVRS